MASFNLIGKEDENYINGFMEWLRGNIDPAQAGQEVFANSIINILNIMRFGTGGIDTSDSGVVNHINYEVDRKVKIKRLIEKLENENVYRMDEINQMSTLLSFSRTRKHKYNYPCKIIHQLKNYY